MPWYLLLIFPLFLICSDEASTMFPRMHLSVFQKEKGQPFFQLLQQKRPHVFHGAPIFTLKLAPKTFLIFVFTVFFFLLHASTSFIALNLHISNCFLCGKRNRKHFLLIFSMAKMNSQKSQSRVR